MQIAVFSLPLTKPPSLVQANNDKKKYNTTKQKLISSTSIEKTGGSRRAFWRASPSHVGESDQWELPATSQAQGLPCPSKRSLATGECRQHMVCLQIFTHSSARGRLTCFHEMTTPSITLTLLTGTTHRDK